MRIIWEVRISEGQITRVILYIYNNHVNYLGMRISEDQIIWAILYIYNNSANYLGGVNKQGSNYLGYTVHL